MKRADTLRFRLFDYLMIGGFYWRGILHRENFLIYIAYRLAYDFPVPTVTKKTDLSGMAVFPFLLIW